MAKSGKPKPGSQLDRLQAALAGPLRLRLRRPVTSTLGNKVTFPTYFRLALFLPIVFGIIAGALFIESPAGILAMAIIAEGPAYLAHIVLVLFWSLGRAQGKLKVASFLMPPLFVPISLAGHVLNGSIQTSGELLGAVMSIGIMILVIGYFYVAVAWAAWFALSWLKGGPKVVA